MVIIGSAKAIREKYFGGYYVRQRCRVTFLNRGIVVGYKSLWSQRKRAEGHIFFF